MDSACVITSNPGNVADGEEFSTALTRITRMLNQNQIARETVTLVLDKGAAALGSTVALEESGLGWISALPWNQALAELRSRAVEELPLCSSAQPGVRAAAEKMLVHLPLVLVVCCKPCAAWHEI